MWIQNGAVRQRAAFFRARPVDCPVRVAMPFCELPTFPKLQLGVGFVSS